MGYQLIETIEVGAGGAASIEFTGIPQDGVDLQVLVSSRGTTTDVLQVLKLTLNADATSGTNKELGGTGSSAFSSSNSYLRAGLVVDDGATANTFASTSIYIPNYTSSAYKSLSSDSVGENNATLGGQSIDALLWSNTSAITSIQLLMNVGNIRQYSTASLYKVTAD